MPGPEQLPVPEDYAQQAADRIDEDNYATELGRITAELQGDIDGTRQAQP